MRWFIAALAFACVVGLAVATAAIQAGNVRARARLEVLQERIYAVDIELAAERQRWVEITRLDNLVELWLRAEERLAGT